MTSTPRSSANLRRAWEEPVEERAALTALLIVRYNVVVLVPLIAAVRNVWRVERERA